MRGAIDETKEISPMFPRLHVKDTEKGGPKAPPRNKMALYEQFSIPSQNFASGSAASLFPLPLRNCTVPTSSSHVGSNQSIQFCTSSTPSTLPERIQAYTSRKINITKFPQDDFISTKNCLKTTLDCEEDAFMSSGSAHGKNSFYSTIQNDKDEDKLSHRYSSCPIKSLNTSRNKVNSHDVIEPTSSQYAKNQMEELREVSQIGQKPEEGPPHPLDGFVNITDSSLISLVKGGNSRSTRKEHRSLKEDFRNVAVDSLKTFQGNRDEKKEEDTFTHFDTSNKPSSDCTLGMDICPDNVLGVLGEKQFWKARRTIINQQRIFLVQVFELHRLIKVQRLIAGSPHILLEDNLILNKPPLKTPAPKKLQSDFLNEQQPSSLVKLSSKSEKTTTTEHAKTNSVGKIPIPYVNNTSKFHTNEISSYGHHLGITASADTNPKQPPSCVFPPPPGNQWLVPIMSPSEGLVYKPIIGPCPPNAGYMAPIYGTCGAITFNSGSKEASDSLQKIGILSGSSSFPQFLPPPPPPPPFVHPSISPSFVEQMGQSNGPENNHHSAGEVNSAVLYQNSSNMSSQTSQAMSINVTNTFHSFRDKELQRSTASSPSKRMKGDVLPLFPMAPTFLPPEEQKVQDENQSRVIRALPHNPRSASESAARIFRSIQEERKHL